MQQPAVKADDERTARALLNLHLVLLYRNAHHTALVDVAKRTRFLAQIVPEDPRLSEVLQTTAITHQLALEYLGKSLEEIMLAASRSFIPLVVPVPPNLERVLGYPCRQGARDARYLGFYYTTSDAPWWEDGEYGQNDLAWGYLGWINHWMVSAGLGRYRDKLGYADAEATHELVLDRQTRLLYVTEREHVRPFLRSQWPVQEDIDPALRREIEAQVAMRVATLMASFQPPSSEEMMAWRQARRQEDARLYAWLDRFWPMRYSVVR